jgi:hypothetical protein
VFLDDTREIPSKYAYSCVRTYEECITLLSVFSEEVEFISLDYNLGKNSKYSGYDVLVFMYENGIHPNHINIHSSHQNGAHKMKEYTEKYFPNTIVTANKIYV